MAAAAAAVEVLAAVAGRRRRPPAISRSPSAIALAGRSPAQRWRPRLVSNVGRFLRAAL